MSEETNAMNDMGEVTDNDKLWALLAYIIPVLVPLIILLMEDKKSKPFLKYHAVIALILGILTYLLSALCIGLLIWLYGVYIGWQAYSTGTMVEVPWLSDFVKKQGWV